MHKIAIHGVPRSGTTWLANIFNSHEKVAYRQQPLFSYAFKDFLDESSSPEKIHKFFREIYKSDDKYLNQVLEIRDGKVPLFNKEKATHLVYKEVRYHYILDNLLQNSDVHLIAIIRSPFATLTSFFKAPSEFHDSWNELEEWNHAAKKNKSARESYFGYSKWKEVVMLFRHLEKKYGKERVTLIKYSDLLENPLERTKDLFSIVKLDISEQTMKFINNSRSFEDPNAYSVFRTKVDDDSWKSTLDRSIVKAIQEDLKNTELEVYL